MLPRVLFLMVLLASTGCEAPDECYGKYWGCEVDDDCWPSIRGPGKCLDDRETGLVCALTFSGCPTGYRWDDCGGNPMDRKSSWAGRCVRPEFIPGYGADMGISEDMPISPIDAPGPS